VLVELLLSKALAQATLASFEYLEVVDFDCWGSRVRIVVHQSHLGPSSRVGAPLLAGYDLRIAAC